MDCEGAPSGGAAEERGDSLERSGGDPGRGAGEGRARDGRWTPLLPGNKSKNPGESKRKAASSRAWVVGLRALAWAGPPTASATSPSGMARGRRVQSPNSRNRRTPKGPDWPPGRVGGGAKAPSPASRRR